MVMLGGPVWCCKFFWEVILCRKQNANLSIMILTSLAIQPDFGRNWCPKCYECGQQELISLRKFQIWLLIGWQKILRISSPWWTDGCVVLLQASGGLHHQCPECGKVFTKPYNLNQHIRQIHRGVRRFQCPLCQRTFTRRAHLTGHLWSHEREKHMLLNQPPDQNLMG